MRRAIGMQRQGMMIAMIAVCACLLHQIAACAANPSHRRFDTELVKQTRSVVGPLAELQWLAGWWRGGDASILSEELWLGGADNIMLGVNRVLRDGTQVWFEHLRVESRADGVYYLASPAGRHPPTPLKMVQCTRNLVVFENPEHDFPQRIRYELIAEDELRARVEGTQHGSAKASEWTWKRVR